MTIQQTIAEAPATYTWVNELTNGENEVIMHFSTKAEANQVAAKLEEAGAKVIHNGAAIYGEYIVQARW